MQCNQGVKSMHAEYCHLKPAIACWQDISSHFKTLKDVPKFYDHFKDACERLPFLSCSVGQLFMTNCP